MNRCQATGSIQWVPESGFPADRARASTLVHARHGTQGRGTATGTLVSAQALAA